MFMPKIVFIEPHVTFLADEALEHADFVIRGEGERPLMAFKKTENECSFIGISAI
jgi:radical SAM superfamily enzyme YgiQ (UPF0313 family)